MTMFDLTGKVAVVTGGGSGLGAASAAALARHGATVVVLDRDQDAAEETALTLGHDSFGLTCDVSDYEQVRSAFTTVAQRCGYVSVLHNNAGVSFNGRGDAPPDELELDMWTHILGINLTGTFLCTKFALPLMTATGRGGSVINMASIAGPWVGTRNTAYAASKGGIVASDKVLGRHARSRRRPGQRHMPRVHEHADGSTRQGDSWGIPAFRRRRAPRSDGRAERPRGAGRVPRVR